MLVSPPSLLPCHPVQGHPRADSPKLAPNLPGCHLCQLELGQPWGAVEELGVPGVQLKPEAEQRERSWVRVGFIPLLHPSASQLSLGMKTSQDEGKTKFMGFYKLCPAKKFLIGKKTRQKTKLMIIVG